MKSGVYCIRNVKNDKVYVGESYDIEARWRAHRGCLEQGSHYNEILQASWNKWGADSFEWEVLELCERELLRKREAHWMNEYNACDRRRGYNIRLEDGEGGWDYNEEQRQALSDRTKGENNPRWGVKLDEDVRRKISEGNKKAYEENTELYKKSEETKRRMAEAKRQYWASKSSEERKLTEEHKKRVGEAGRGRKHSEEAKLKMAESNRRTKAERPPGPISEETRKKMSDARMGRAAWNKGLAMPEEFGSRISEKLKGRTQSPETKALAKERRRETIEARKAEGWQRKPRSADGNAKWRESMQRYHEQKKREKALETPVPLPEAGYITNMESGGNDGERIDREWHDCEAEGRVQAPGLSGDDAR